MTLIFGIDLTLYLLHTTIYYDMNYLWKCTEHHQWGMEAVGVGATSHNLGFGSMNIHTGYDGYGSNSNIQRTTPEVVILGEVAALNFWRTQEPSEHLLWRFMRKSLMSDGAD